MNQDASVRVVATLWTEEPVNSDSIPGRSKRFYVFSKASRLSLESIRPPIQWEAGIFLRVLSGQECEAADSPPSKAEVKNVWKCIFAFRYVSLAWSLTKQLVQGSLSARRWDSTSLTVVFIYCESTTISRTPRLVSTA
jgi:hypothetical protein